jgi:hypothetical protein
VLSASAQSGYVKYPLKENFKKLKSPYYPISFKTESIEEVKPPKPLTIIPGNYYTKHFGIMCKKELAFEKVTKIPSRLRLGSLQQCNYLEGKR